MLNTVRRTGLVISLAGLAISVNTLPALVTWFSFRFEIPVASFGIIFLLQYAAFTLCSLTIGRLHASRRLPLYGIVICSLAVSSVCLFFIGLLPSFPLLVFAMIIIGGTGGLVESIGTTLLTSSEGSNRMLYTSQFFYAFGAFFAPMLVGLLLNLDVSVPSIGHLIGVFTMAIGILVWLLVYQPYKAPATTIRTSSEGYRLSVTMVDPKRDGDTAPSDFEVVDGSTRIPKHTIFRAFPLLFITMVSYVFIESAVGNWFAVYVDKAMAFTPADASFTLSLFWIGLGIARLFTMIWIIRDHPRTLLIHMGMMLVAVLLLLLPMVELGKVWLFATVFILGFGCGPVWPLLIEYCSRIFVQEHFLMYLVGAGSIGALLGPIITSTLFSLIGIYRMHVLFFVYVLIMLVAAIITVGIITRSRRNDA